MKNLQTVFSLKKIFKNLLLSLYRGLETTSTRGTYDQSTSLNVLVRNVQCNGNESNIFKCPFELNDGICEHDKDVGIVCLGDPETENGPSINANNSNCILAL